MQIQNIEKIDSGKYGVGLGTLKSYFIIDVVDKIEVEEKQPQVEVKEEAETTKDGKEQAGMNKKDVEGKNVRVQYWI